MSISSVSFHSHEPTKIVFVHGEEAASWAASTMEAASGAVVAVVVAMVLFLLRLGEPDDIMDLFQFRR